VIDPQDVDLALRRMHLEDHPIWPAASGEEALEVASQLVPDLIGVLGERTHEELGHGRGRLVRKSSEAPLG